MLKNFFIPTKQNNFTPHLLNIKSLALYLVIIIVGNFVLGAVISTSVSAAIDITTLYKYHNEERARYGLEPLAANSQLVASAKAKAEAMLEADCWSHYCPDGTSPWTFFESSGYYYVYAGENLAEGFEVSDKLMQAWMNSPTHKENVINPKFDEIGIGTAKGKFQGIENNTVVVVHFGARTAKAAVKPATNTVADPDKGISISRPVSGDSLSSKHLEVIGNAEKSDYVEIRGNGVVLGKADVTQNEFNFKPSELSEGSYQLQAIGYQNNLVSGKSQIINFQVDDTPPTINTSTVSVDSLVYDYQENSGYALIKVQTGADTYHIETMPASASVTRSSETSWEMKIRASDLIDNKDFKISAKDKAGNLSVVDIDATSINSQIKAMQSEFDFSAENSTTSLTSFLGGDRQLTFNLIFVLILAALFAIDFYVITHSGLTAELYDRSKSHLHLSSLIILILVIIFGSLSGNILTGVTQ